MVDKGWKTTKTAKQASNAVKTFFKSFFEYKTN